MRQSLTALHEKRPEPLRAGPEEAEPGLNRRAEIRLVRRELVQQQAEVKRHDAPDERNMLEWRPNQLGENTPIMAHAHVVAICPRRRCSFLVPRSVEG